MKKAELLAEQERLLALANELARKHWGVDYTGTIELVNRKWRRMQGVYAFNDSTGLRKIKMSAQTNAERSPEEVEDTLLHELVHWRLQTRGVPASDTDPEFIAECLRVGASISHAKYAQAAYKAYLERQEAAA